MSGAPTGLVHYTNNTSQRYVETEEMLTEDEKMECEVEDFVEYEDVLKASGCEKGQRDADANVREGGQL